MELKYLTLSNGSDAFVIDKDFLEDLSGKVEHIGNVNHQLGLFELYASKKHALRLYAVKILAPNEVDTYDRFNIGMEVTVIQYAGLSRAEWKGTIRRILTGKPETTFLVETSKGYMEWVRYIELADGNPGRFK